MIHLIRSYTELIKIPTFIERYRYLKLDGKVGEETLVGKDTSIRSFTIHMNGEDSESK